MLVYLSKKIAIPNQTRLNCISWNRDQGFIACGGESNLLKVLRLESPSGAEAVMQGIAASANLSMNQSLEGHNGGVMCVAWNPIFKKLTTSDESGLIIVWMLHKGSWYEEMINNRNKSVVRDMKWTTDGRKIAIVYEDGAVIVGSVDGNRLWGKDLPYQLRFVEWSPDGKLLLFVTMDAEVHIYDADGNKLRSMKLMGQDNNGLGGDAMITAIHWFAPHGSHNSHVFARPGEQLPHTLIIAFENGKMLLSRGEDESSAELIDSELQSIVFARWSTKGTTLAVVGMAKQGQEGRSRKDRDSGNNIVKFFDCFGRPIRSLRIPGDNIREVSWEGGDLRMALAVDSFIYFANVRHQYLWASFLNTIVYAYPKSDRRDHILTFWDLVTQETYAKTVSNLKLVAAAGDYCAIVVSEKVNQASLKDPAAEEKSSSKNDDDDKAGGGNNNNNSNNSNSNSKANRNVLVDVYTVQLRNAIGAVVDTKTVPFAPKYIAMSPFHVALANDRTVFTWQFQASSGAIRSGGVRNSSSALLDDPNDDDVGGVDEPSGGRRGGGLGSKRGGADKCRIFDIENVGFSTAQSPETFRVLTDFIPDFITSITISDKYLVVARKNQTIQRFNIPHLTPENVYALRDRDVYKMQLNNTSSRLAVVDGNGLFTILDLDFKVPRANNSRQDDGESSMVEDEKQQDLSMSGRVSRDKDNGSGQYLSDSFGRKLNIDRKDVWDLQWSEDDPEMLVVMEKTKMVVIQHETPEEPVLSSAYLARFRDLEIRVVALDALFQHPDKPSRELVIDFESKLLREVRDLVAHEGLQRGYGDVETHPHPRLWKLIAHAALEDLDFPMAEKAFVRYGDYFGIKFAQQMAQMPDKMKARAEVAVFLQRFDEAEGIYREIDRKDLAISLRKRVGDYARVVQLLQTGGGNDQLAREAWDQIGNYYADRMKWKKAAQYFQLSRNVDALAECFYRTEQFADLEKLAKDLPDEAPLLYSLAKRFESVGMAEEAVTCFLRSGCPPKEAVDCCVKLNHWAKALTLAEKYDFPQVEGLLIKLAMQFVQSNRRLEAIELFRVANKPTEAAILIGDLAETVAQDMANPALAKKLHVLAALEVERHRKRALEQATQQENAGRWEHRLGDGRDAGDADDDVAAGGRQRGQHPRESEPNAADDAQHARDPQRHGRQQREESVEGLRQRLARRRGVPLLHGRPAAVLRGARGRRDEDVDQAVRIRRHPRAPHDLLAALSHGAEESVLRRGEQGLREAGDAAHRLGRGPGGAADAGRADLHRQRPARPRPVDGGLRVVAEHGSLVHRVHDHRQGDPRLPRVHVSALPPLRPGARDRELREESREDESGSHRRLEVLSAVPQRHALHARRRTKKVVEAAAAAACAPLLLRIPQREQTKRRKRKRKRRKKRKGEGEQAPVPATFSVSYSINQTQLNSYRVLHTVPGRVTCVVQIYYRPPTTD